jgi:intein/homing endonuclease
METTPDRALAYAIIQGGVQALQTVKDLGINASHFVDKDDRAVFEYCEKTFLPKAVMPTTGQIRQHLKLDLPDIEPGAVFDPELCAKDVLKRSLVTNLLTNIGPIEQLIPKDPFKARDQLGDLVKSTNWSQGSVVRTNSPMAYEESKKRYLEAKARDGGLLGFSSMWPSRDKRSLGFQPGEVTVLLAKRKSGKTIGAATLMHDPVTGQPTTIQQLVMSGKAQVYTWSERSPITSTTPDDYIDAGVKDCLRITWRSGRYIDAAPTHPFLTPTGWKKTADLVVGHHTAAVRKLPAPTEIASLPEAEIKALAYLIADGGVTNGISYTKHEPKLVTDLKSAVEDYYQCEMNETPQFGVYSISGGGGANLIADVLGKHGVMGKKSVAKTIPAAIFSLGDQQLGLFLGRLWCGDGSIEASGKVSYSTGTKEMAFQIQHLLLRFGVTSRVRELYRTPGQNGKSDYYEVVIHNECIESFRTHIKLLGEMSTRLNDVRFDGESVVGWLKNEELRDTIIAEMNSAPQLLEQMGEKLGYSFKLQRGHVFDSESGRFCRKFFAAFCEVYDSPLKWVLDENIYWDEIESIESIGPQQVYDLSIPETHCYIANDFVVHNSWLLLKLAEHIWTAKLPSGEPELKPGENILVVSMEMPTFQVLRRFFAIHKKLDYEKFRSGHLDQLDETRFFDWCDQMATPNPTRAEVIFVASDKVRTVDDIVGLVAQYRPKAVFIDSFYILTRRDGRMPMWERMLENIKEIKLNLAVKFGVPVIATTQLSGAVKRGDLNAEADAISFAKAVGDFADSIDGIFGNDKFRGSNKRILRGMEAREFVTVDLEINFDPVTHNYSEIRVLDKVEEGDGKSLDTTGDDDDRGSVNPDDMFIQDSDDPL